MEILIFILVLVILIVVHELGHFVAAKLSGMRVDEFGLGYPPRALVIATKGETTYTLNWLPFGGFVKIFGEDLESPQAPRSFSSKPRLLQAIVLVAGVAMNFLLAYVLLTSALLMGTPRALAPEEIPYAKNAELAVAAALPGSPADMAGLMPGDSIISATDQNAVWKGSDPEAFTQFVAQSAGHAITLEMKRNGGTLALEATPRQGVVASDPSRYALGVQVATIGVVPLSFIESVTQGARLTWEITKATAVGLAQFFWSLFTFSANLSQVSGPVGIAQAVGSASSAGFGNLLSLMSIISINLALINLIPIPALDGGRLLFVIIESIIRRPIKASVANGINSVGFALLLLLMVVVTANDIFRIIG